MMSLDILVILVVILPISVYSETLRLEREISKTTIIPSTDNKILNENDSLENSLKKLNANETTARILNDVNSKIKYKESVSIPVNDISTVTQFNKDVGRLQNAETTTQSIKLSPITIPISSKGNLTKLLPLKVYSFNNTVDNALDKSELLNEEKIILPMKNELNISVIKHDNWNNFNDITENITSPGNDDLINLEKNKVNAPVEIETSVNKSNSISSNHLIKGSTTRKYKLLDTDVLQQHQNETNTGNNKETFNKKLMNAKSEVSEPSSLNRTEDAENFTEKIAEKINVTKSKVTLTTTEQNVLGTLADPVQINTDVNKNYNETKADLNGTNTTENDDFHHKKTKEKLLNTSSETTSTYNTTSHGSSVTENTERFLEFTTTAKTDLKFTSAPEYTVSTESSTENLNSIDTTKFSIESTTSNPEINVTSDSSTINNDAEFDFYISTVSLGLNDDIFTSTQSSNLAPEHTKTEKNDIKISTTTESNFETTIPQIMINNSIQLTTMTPKIPKTTKMQDVLVVDQTSESNNEKFVIPQQKDEPTTGIPVTHSTIANIEGEHINESEPDYVWIAIGASAIGIIALISLVFISCYYMKKRSKLTYGQRCRPVSLDAYSLDNISIHNSVRRREKSGIRASKKSFGNIAFDDPSLKHNAMGIHELAKFIEKKSSIFEEFKSIPQITARADEVPQGCEDKNRYANVIPLPETRVLLQRQNEDETTEYINANYVRGPKDIPNYYIACQAPIENTITDFWRMVWEQNCYVVIMATDIIENGIEKCAEYLPQSNFANSLVFENFHITLKNREVKQKYAITTMNLKNSLTNTTREITHFWYKWPETGVPTDESAIIAMLLEARSCLKMPPNEFSEVNGGNTNPTNDTNENNTEVNNKMDKTKTKTQGPLIVHCSPGTGRTGTIIACDIAVRSLEQTRRTIDIPQFVYYIRRGRASAVLTKEQYEFIYRVSNLYATKISGPIIDN